MNRILKLTPSLLKVSEHPWKGSLLGLQIWWKSKGWMQFVWSLLQLHKYLWDVHGSAANKKLWSQHVVLWFSTVFCKTSYWNRSYHIYSDMQINQPLCYHSWVDFGYVFTWSLTRGVLGYGERPHPITFSGLVGCWTSRRATTNCWW